MYSVGNNFEWSAIAPSPLLGDEPNENSSLATPAFGKRESGVQIGNNLEFRCIKDDCGEVVKFSVFDMAKNDSIRCGACGKEYTFGDELVSKLDKFEKLCRAVNEAQEILSDTNVAINVYSHEVKIPFRLLLTRLNTQLNLDVGGRDVQIRFRVSPLKDIPQAAKKKA
jgi:hypothetical protein